MKITNLFFFILLSTTIFGVSKEGDELQILNEIIASSERKLMVCKELRSLITNFHEQQKTFHQGEQTKELAIQMVQTASKILCLSKNHELIYLFSPFFIEELNLFSGLAKKKQSLP